LEEEEAMLMGRFRFKRLKATLMDEIGVFLQSFWLIPDMS
jgi:hypothetical protein